jgi:para-aminobenzoate synthetase component I
MDGIQIIQVHRRAEFRSLAMALRGQKEFIWFDSQLVGHPSSERSLLCTDFRAILTFKHGVACIQDGQGNDLEVIQNASPWDVLARFRTQYPGYHAGFLGYDLKNYDERLNSSQADEVGLPEMWFGVPSTIYIQEQSDQTTQQPNGSIDEPKITVSSVISEQSYIEAVQKAQLAIYEGDVYEVNLSHQLRAEFSGDALELYEYMYRRGPVPYAAFLHIQGFDICCASPERFLQKRGKVVVSDPIKGTRPRGINEHEDAIIRKQLSESEKEKAENLMIVDLVRNDLGRVAVPGTVSVPSLFEIQSFGTVHQMVSRVQATLRDDVTLEQVLCACFPMGSMTGAPKIRAMEIIDELESYKRGLYSGAIGFITPEGDANFNVVIRSAIIKQQTLWYSAGGAITSDSDPMQEWIETLVKIRALGLDLER